MSKQPIKIDYVPADEQAERSRNRKGLSENQEVMAEASNESNNADDTEDEAELAEVEDLEAEEDAVEEDEE